MVRKAISRGLDAVRALQMATLNTAEHFRLKRTGAIAPGYAADLIVIGDLSKLDVEMVFHRGKLVAREGKVLFRVPPAADSGITHTVNVKPFDIGALKIPASKKDLPVIEIVPGQIITRSVRAEAKIEDGQVVPDPSRDLLKLVVVERHKASGRIGAALVRGFGLKDGALGSSIAHDSHNIVVVGTNDRDILAAVREIERLRGGLVAAAGGGIRGSLALPVAGLLSREPLETVVSGLEELQKAAAGLGCVLPSPFATLSFLALPVIPELRLTDRGLVDVNAFKVIE